MHIDKIEDTQFLLTFEPMEISMLAVYLTLLRNSQVDDIESLLVFLFQQQADFICDCLQVGVPCDLLGIRSKMPKVSPN